MLKQLERRLRWLAIPNLTLYLVLGQTAFFAVGLVSPDILGMLELIPERVLAGEYWRLLLFMLMPAVSPHDALSVLFMFFAMYLLWLMGGALEKEWGSFRYTLFVLIGYLATLGVAWIHPAGSATNAYILTSIFLAFAVLYPDFTIYVFLVLPVKVKWLALMTWAILGISFLTGDWSVKVLILASVANFLLFFWPVILDKARGGHRRVRRQREVVKAAAEPFHRCNICGRTDRSDPSLEFRYAQTADGVQCFCKDHLPGSV